MISFLAGGGLNRLGKSAEDMGVDPLGKFIDLRNDLIHGRTLGEDIDGRLVGGDIKQLAVDAQTAADLCDAAPDDEVRVEFLSHGEGIGRRKLPARGFLQGRQGSNLCR